jgi:hypothetical protein
MRRKDPHKSTDLDPIADEAELLELYRLLTPEKRAYIVFMRRLVEGLNPEPPTPGGWRT